MIALNSKRLLAGLAALLLALACHAQERKWMTLDCVYLADKSNDGDSFLVQCGREKFFVRLYFVDAPETDVDFPDRVRQQYDYFGVDMDDLTRAGLKARAHANGLQAIEDRARDFRKGVWATYHPGKRVMSRTR